MTSGAWRGQAQGGRHEYSWQKGQRPSEHDWSTWRIWLTKVFTTGELPPDSRWLLSQPRFRQLASPLGRWLPGAKCQWLYHKNHNRLYCTIPTMIEYTQVPGRASRGTRGSYGNPTPCNELPQSLCPATVEWSRGLVKLTGYADVVQHESNEATSMQERIAGLPTEWQALLAATEWPDDGRGVANAISARRAVAVSDGTVREGRGAASAVLEGQTSAERISLNCTVPGHEESQASFRSEAVGLLMIVVAVKTVCEHHGIDQGEITVACDGQAALNACFSKNFKIDPGAPHYDVITAVRTVVKQCSIKFDPVHVKGHQEIRPLDRLGALNEEMDTECKAWWARDELPLSELFPNEAWSVWLKGRKITSDIKAEISNFVGTETAEQYWDN
jgi:hypothetical protein